MKLESLFVFLILLLIFLTFAYFVYSRLDLYKISENNISSSLLSNEQILNDTEGITQEIIDNRERELYSSTYLHRGNFVEYDKNSQNLVIEKELNQNLSNSREKSSFSVPLESEVLCWPTNVPGTDMPWNTTYIALEEGGYLFLNDEKETTFKEIYLQLNYSSYIFIHESAGVIKEIAVTGC